MKLKWYHIIFLVCDLTLFLIGVLSGIIFFCYNLLDMGIITIVFSVLVSVLLLFFVFCMVKWDNSSIKKLLGTVMVKADGLLKINNNKNIDVFIQFCKNGLFIQSEEFGTQAYSYKFVNCGFDSVSKYKITMYIDSLGKCDFTCNSILKIKAIKHLLQKYSM